MPNKKLCYVIMPFSKTETCSEGEWTTIFNGLIKPAVEEAGLNYECRRSSATTGNLIKGIVQDLYRADIVVADLTDQRPNVFYELGVRHTLRNRTILIAQRREDIVSDLIGYANHVYDWKSKDGLGTFRAKIRELLIDIEQNPDRSDNPVSDFVHESSVRILEFQREENSRKLRALIFDLEFVRTILRSALDAALKSADGTTLSFYPPSPALDHLIAIQYIYHFRFSYQASALRAALQLCSISRPTSDTLSGILARLNIFCENGKKVLSAYEAGNSLDALPLEDFPGV